MLRQLAIQNVVLVERLELEFEPGLGVPAQFAGSASDVGAAAHGVTRTPRAGLHLERLR